MINENDMLNKYFYKVDWKNIMDDAKQLSELPLTPLFKHIDSLLNGCMEHYATGDKIQLKKSLIKMKKTIREIEESL